MFQSIMTKLVQGPYKMGHFHTKSLFLDMYPKGQNDQWIKMEHVLKTNNLNFGGIQKHNPKKIMPLKPQIISYHHQW
jgi:hypothetical protein